MKIAYIRYNGLIQLGHEFIDTGSMMDLRTNMFIALCNKGHTIDIFGNFKSQDFLIKNKNTLNGNLRYHKDKIPDYNNFDFLIIENGASNTNFTFNYKGENLPYIVFSNMVLKKWKGIVFYLNLDTQLPFVFFPEFFSLKYINQFLHYGNFNDILKDKKFFILTCAKKQKEFLELNSGVRYPNKKLFENGSIFIEYFEAHYFTVNKNFYQEYKVNKKAEDSIVYIGAQRPRIFKFNKYYGNFSNHFKVKLYGSWSPSFVKNKFPKINFFGRLGKGLVYKTYNENFLSVLIGDVSYEKINQISGRFFESIQSRNIPLVDYSFKDSIVLDILGESLLKELLLFEDDLRNIKKVKKFLNFSFQERKSLLRELNLKINKFDMWHGVEELEKLFKKCLLKKDVSNKKIMTGVENTFTELLVQRANSEEFSKLHYDAVLIKYYEKNGGDFILSKNKKVKYDEKLKCFKCGETFLKKNNSVFASRMKCDLCKKDSISGDFIKRLNYNLRKFFRKIK